MSARGRQGPGQLYLPTSACQVRAYSAWLAPILTEEGPIRRGSVQSVFGAAANLSFSDDLLLSLNASSAARMPNGLQLTAAPGMFPFSALRPGQPVLLGGSRLQIEPPGCSFDLTLCARWEPWVVRPPDLDHERVAHNLRWLDAHYALGGPPLELLAGAQTLTDVAWRLCGRGFGLTPAGDDMLAGWLALGWLLTGPDARLTHAGQQIVALARQRTHPLSQAWLRCAAAGAFALPIVDLLTALAATREPSARASLSLAAEAVLALGASSGRDLLRGLLLGQWMVERQTFFT